MGRGVSAGGGQSSLGYLFGSGEPSAPQAPHKEPVNDPPLKTSSAPHKEPVNDPPLKTSSTPPQMDNSKQTPAGGNTGYATNNYYRTDGQNCGNFITDRPSTKVHAAPGGNSSLNYLFGDGSK